jgi:hypothetical protein
VKEGSTKVIRWEEGNNHILNLSDMLLLKAPQNGGIIEVPLESVNGVRDTVALSQK